MNAELQKMRDLHIANGEIHTNFGWLTPDQVKKGLEWGAVTWAYKQHGIFSVCRDKGKKNRFDTLSCWLAYLEREQKNPDWYKHFERRAKDGENTIDDVAVIGQFKALTGISVPLQGTPMWSAPHEDSQRQLKIGRQTP